MTAAFVLFGIGIGIFVICSLAPLFKDDPACKPPTHGGHHDRRDSAGAGHLGPVPVFQADERDEP